MFPFRTAFRTAIPGLVALGTLPLLAGCGGSGGGAAAGWATNACAVLDKDAVAATLGAAVARSRLSAVRTGEDGAPFYSQCEFKLADGRFLVISTTQVTDGKTLGEQIAMVRTQGVDPGDPQPVDVAGIGKAGLWVPGLMATHAFLGDGRDLAATLMQTDFRKGQITPEKTKADEIAILKKAGA